MPPNALFKAIDSLPVLLTLRAGTHEPQAALAKRVEEVCAGWTPSSGAVVQPGALALLKAGLLDAVDILDAAHAVFQDDPSPEGSYWHGMLHRREGDFWNAKYWFQRAGRPSTLKALPEFDPVRFVTRCERAGAEDPPELLSLQRTEWEHLMQAAYEKAFRI
jgi:hypothetical protein